MNRVRLPNRRKHFRGGGGAACKSVIFDFKNAWLSDTRAGVRSLEFTQDSIVIVNNATLSAAYATSTNNANFLPEFAFDTALSKIGAQQLVCWRCASQLSFDLDQRLILVFNDPTAFNGITANNYHNSGASTNEGMKDTKIYTSTDEITDTTYGAAISNSTLIYDSTILEHVALDQIDDQILTLL